eukprot:3119951-Rhodomonas_salina.1
MPVLPGAGQLPGGIGLQGLLSAVVACCWIIWCLRGRRWPTGSGLPSAPGQRCSRSGRCWLLRQGPVRSSIPGRIRCCALWGTVRASGRSACCACA